MSVDSVGDDAAANAQLGRPVSDAQRPAVRSDHASASLVAGLIRRGRPPAVGGFVVTVAVDALKGQPGRALAHVRQKVQRALQPGVAYANASPTIVWKLLVRWILAPRFHVDPYVVFLSSCEPMSQIGFGRPFLLQAAAGLDRAGAKMKGADNLRFAAITAAIPIVGSSALSGKAGNNQTANTQASAVNKFRHFITSIMVNNHCGTRSNRVIEVLLSAAKPSYAGAF